MKKICIRCGEEKELELFYKHSAMKDGHLNKCIECCKKCARANGQTERVKWYNRNRPNAAERNKKHKEYMQQLKLNNPEKYYAMKKGINDRYEKNHEIAAEAHRIVTKAIRTGKLIQPEKCELCWKVAKVEAHHFDYSKPLEVIWLCSECHHVVHKNLRHKKRNEKLESIDLPFIAKKEDEVTIVRT